MPFTVKEYPGQLFRSMKEYDEAKRRRHKVERSIATRSNEVTKVTATIIPASKALLERKVVTLEKQIKNLTSEVERLSSKTSAKKKANNEGLIVGTIFQGESRGQKYTLEVLEEGYLCSNGGIYQSLSGAALGVSGNRRSGWKFWKNIEGNPIGKLTGRFGDAKNSNPFHTHSMS